MKICLILFTVVFIVGCSSLSDGESSGNRVFTDEGIPMAKYLVGGGIDISYIPSVGGTAHWVEETSKKILQTKTLKSGETGTFVLSAQSPEDFEELTGTKLSEAKFSLYFVPSIDDAFIPY